MAKSVLEEIERFTLYSADAGVTYTISVSRSGKRLEGKLPIFVVLDADLDFGMAAEFIALAYVGQAIVVGIGHSASLSEMQGLRLNDFAPRPAGSDGDAPKPLPGLAVPAPTGPGGADTFLSFILDEVVPEILRRYEDASPDRRFLFGHSLGGLFVAYALMTRPDAFSAYLISSPAVWFDDFLLLRRREEFRSAPLAPNREPAVFICVAASEQDPVYVLPNHPACDGMDLASYNQLIAHARMVDGAKDLAAAIATGFARTAFHIFEDEDHLTVLPAAIARSIRFALRLE